MAERVAFAGRVGQGEGRGRRLGFPTANLEEVVGEHQVLRRGVYVARVRWEKEPWRGAVVNIGVRPTWSQGKWAVEVYVLDFAGDLYGKRLEVELGERLRDEQRFASVEALVTQIEKDVARARAILARE